MIFRNYVSASTKYCELESWEPAPYIRKSFEVNFVPEKAELSVSTAGFYELFVNGKKITKGEMAPYINNPAQICYYDTYDVADLLVQGENVIGVILGNGFANQCIDAWDFSKAEFRAPLCVAMNLSVSDGENEFFVETDESFKGHPSPVLFDMYRYGMHYDANREEEGWCSPGFDDSHWENVHCVEAPKGVKRLCETQPVKVQYEVKPVSIEKQEDFYYLHRSTAEDSEPMKDTYVKEGWLYDFGASHSGVCRLKIKGEKGQKIILRHCEALRCGKFNFNSIYTFKEDYSNYMHLFQTDSYILKGGEEEIFTPSFTYHGFRYVLVEGITGEQATEDLLTFVVMNSDIIKRGQFSCSDETLNKLYGMGINAIQSNFFYFPTDCPHREKNGWTGDVSVSSKHILQNFDCSESFKAWMENIRLTQLESGMLPAIVPTTGWGYQWGNGPTWDAVIVNLPYYALKYDGRIDLFEENADMIYKYLVYIAGRRDERGLVNCGLGDWSQPNPESVRLESLDLTESCMVLDMAEKSSLMFERIGRIKESKYTRALAEEMRSAIRGNLVDPETMTVKGNCQTVQALALAMGIFDEEEYPKAYARLIEMIEEKDRHSYCGMLGVRYLFHVLFANGDGSLAYEMITKETEPSYASMIKRGGTALFESLCANGVQESQNHHFLGDILNLFVTRMAGLVINPYMDDKDEILVAPYVIDELDYAEASFASDKGEIRASWKKESDKVYIEVFVPEGVHGTVVWQDEEYALSEGMNHYILNRKVPF